MPRRIVEAESVVDDGDVMRVRMESYDGNVLRCVFRGMEFVGKVGR